MDPERYERSKRCFERALELPEGEREAFVRAEAGGDGELAAEVLGLLASVAADTALDPLLGEPPRRAGLPERIGSYRILGLAGRGGMGRVYEAQQDRPRRRVALKVIDADRVDEGVLRRFHVEAEALGRLDHPGLARIFEAGTFERGDGPQPYFALEFVRGRSLVEHADAAGLDRRGRLELLLQVVDAVAYAHGQGVVHRDLKPANILVDETGRPKVLDFGVARVEDPEVPRATLQTTAGQLVGTLPYMSPEQASGEPGRIDGRTDVYSLGVLAHELLTGRLPLPMDGLSVQEAVRRLAEDDPEPLGAHDPSLRGDLEVLVGKALEKDPARRYPSANSLADDLRRTLSDQPIAARPPSRIYLLSKFTRRHRGLVVGSGLGVVTAIGGLTVALVFSLANARELARSEARALRQSDRSSIAAASAALDNGAYAYAAEQLARVPGDRRGWEWRYFAAQLDTSLALHVSPRDVAAIAFEAGGVLVIADAGGRILRWDPQSGEVLGEVDLGRELPVRDPATPDTDVGCALEATGRRLALLGAEEVLVFDPTSGALVASRPRPANVRELALSPSGDRIALAGSGGLWAWNLATDSFRQVDSGPTRRLDFAEDGLLFAFSQNVRGDQALVFDLERDQRTEGLTQTTRLLDAELVNGGRDVFVARADDKKALRRVSRGSAERIYAHHTLLPLTVAWSESSGRAASGGADRLVCVWDPERPEAPLAVLHGNAAPVEQIRFGVEGRRVAAVAGREVRVWDLEDLDAQTVLAHPTYVYTVDFEPEGRLLTSDWSGRFRRWSAGGELLEELQSRGAGSRLARSADGGLSARAHWHELALLDGELHTIGRTTFGEPRLSDVSLSASGHRLATRDPYRIRVLSTPGLEPIFERDRPEHLPTPDDRFGAVLLDAAGARVFAQDWSGEIVVWGLPTGHEVLRLPGGPSLASRMALSPDEARLAVGFEDGWTRVFDLGDGRPPLELERHASRVYALAFTPDGTRLATGSDDTTVRLWELNDGVETAVFDAHTDYVYDLDFSPDGERLASASGDGTVRLWDTRPRHAR